MINAADISQPRRIAALGFLLIGYFFYAWSWNTVDILRPYIQEELKLTLTQSGSLYTVQAIGAILGAVVMGQVADKIGRQCRRTLAEYGSDPNLITLAVDTLDAPVAQRFIEDPAVQIIDFTGSPRYGDHLERTITGKLLYTPTTVQAKAETLPCEKEVYGDCIRSQYGANWGDG